MGWDDNVPWPCTHGRCHTKSKAGVGWGGMITFFGLAHMVDATQHAKAGVGWGGVGWGGMITFFGLAHMVDATQHAKAGVGWGGVG